MGELSFSDGSRFWTFRHAPGENTNSRDAAPFVELGLRHCYCAMQYEYAFQNQTMVTQHWDAIINGPRVGDVVFLRGQDMVYAVGVIVLPRMLSLPHEEVDVTDGYPGGADGPYCSRGTSPQKIKRICFKKDGCLLPFYEELDGEQNWGQRVDVDNWSFISHDGIYAKEDANFVKGSNRRLCIRELTRSAGVNLIHQLKQQVLKESNMDSNCVQLLEAGKNLILTGAPGTGKTYMARQIAEWIVLHKIIDEDHPATEEDRRLIKDHVGFVQFHPSYDYSDFVEGLRPIKCEDSEAVGFERQDGVFKAFCKQAVQNISSNFDEKYDEFSEMMSEKHASAEDALQLNTPNGTPFKVFLNSRRSLSLITGDGSKVQGSLTPEKLRTFLTATPYKYWAIYFKGVIKYLKDKHGLKVAQSNADCPYVFIIDEINRGDLSKIFGELFYSIDPGYRVKHGANADVVKVQTRYANMLEDGDVFKDGFYIPDNVYIIGTMNDIDRSVESMDFAIRRRFTWKKIHADETRLAAVWGADGSTASVTLEDVKPRYRELNKAIEECASDGLGEAFMIGPSYYLKLKGMGLGKDDCFKALWDLHLKPLLQEYVRGLPNALELMEKFENAYRLERTDAAAAS